LTPNPIPSMIARLGLIFIGGVIVFKTIKTSVFASALILAGLAFVAPASANTIVVDAFANSTSGGIGADAGALTSGQAFSVTVPLTDLWNAGALPRWSNANGLFSGLNLVATGTDDSGQPAGTQIGVGVVNWTQGNLTAPFGSLVGSIGNGDFFLIGTNFSGLASASGELRLWYFDQNNGDNTEHITATVTTYSIRGVPEPSTWAMMILGFAGVFVYRRKSKPALLAA